MSNVLVCQKIAGGTLPSTRRKDGPEKTCFCKSANNHPDGPACFKEDGSLQKILCKQSGRAVTTVFIQMGQPFIKRTVQ